MAVMIIQRSSNTSTTLTLRYPSNVIPSSGMGFIDHPSQRVLVWNAPWKLGKWLFLGNRYLPIAYVTLWLYSKSPLFFSTDSIIARGISDWFSAQPTSTLVSIIHRQYLIENLLTSMAPPVRVVNCCSASLGVGIQQKASRTSLTFRLALLTLSYLFADGDFSS